MEPHLQDPLFRIDDGEFRIGRKSVAGEPCDLIIVFDTAPSVLLVAPDDEFDRPLRHETLVLERFQGEERTNGRSLVVRRTAPPDLPVRNFAAEGIVRPAVPCGNDVEMTEDGKIFPSPVRDFADIILIVLRFEPHLFRKGEKILQAFCRTFAERLFRCSFGERGICPDEVRYGTDRFFLILVHSLYSISAEIARVIDFILCYCNMLSFKSQS